MEADTELGARLVALLLETADTIALLEPAEEEGVKMLEVSDYLLATELDPEDHLAASERRRRLEANQARIRLIADRVRGALHDIVKILGRK